MAAISKANPLLDRTASLTARYEEILQLRRLVAEAEQQHGSDLERNDGPPANGRRER